ncbi:MAG: thiamine pyrophosphate-binding protein, partial [Alphaproteobacteria bacterium]
EKIINFGLTPKKGPIFIEIPLDISAKNVSDDFASNLKLPNKFNEFSKNQDLDSIYLQINKMISQSSRPIMLLGAGVSRDLAEKVYDKFLNFNIPIATTWNALDRIDANHPLYFGRPNNWGQRYSNIIIQQSDLLIAIGSRLGIQQTGFNYQEFVPNGKI